MTVQQTWELKLASGKTVSMRGTDGVHAARRYVDIHRDAVVVATRPGDQYGIFVLGNATIDSGTARRGMGK